MNLQNQTQTKFDLEACFRFFTEAGVLSCATVSSDGVPQIRSIEEYDVEAGVFYFLTAKGSSLARHLGNSAVVAFSALDKETRTMVRLRGYATQLDEETQLLWKVRFYALKPQLRELYPYKTWQVGRVYAVENGLFEVLRRSGRKVERQYLPLGHGFRRSEWFSITDICAGCGACRAVCPADCIGIGKPMILHEENCLHCGACADACPRGAIVRFGENRLP